MAFDELAFFDTLDEVEKLLGYLWGNERAFLYLRSVRSDLIRVSEEYPPEVEGMTQVFVGLDDYKFPCPEGQYAVRPLWTDGKGSYPLRFGVFRPTDEEGAEAAHTKFLETLKANTNLAYQQGIGTATGTAAYCRSVCAQFTKVQPDAIADTLVDLQSNVLSKLQPESNPDWAAIQHVASFWTGVGATGFKSFLGNLNAGLGRCHTYSSHVVAAFGMLAMLSHGTQVATQTYVESVRDNLKKQLEEWVYQESRPAEPAALPGWYADFSKIFSATWEVAGDIPVIGVAKEQVDKFVSTTTNVVNLVSAIAEVSGHEFGEERASIKIEGAEAIYDDLTDTLYNTHYQGYLDGLEQLYAGDPDAPPPTDPDATLPFSIEEAERQVHQLQDDRQWSPGEVSSTGSMRDDGDDYTESGL